MKWSRLRKFSKNTKKKRFFFEEVHETDLWTLRMQHSGLERKKRKVYKNLIRYHCRFLLSYGSHIEGVNPRSNTDV